MLQNCHTGSITIRIPKSLFSTKPSKITNIIMATQFLELMKIKAENNNIAKYHIITN